MKKLISFVVSFVALLSLANIALAADINPDQTQKQDYPTLPEKNMPPVEDYYAEPGPIPSVKDSYFGIALGVDANKEAQIIKRTGVADNEKSYRGSGLAVAFVGGSGINFNHFYIGGEGSLTYSTAKGKLTDTGSDGLDYETNISTPITLAIDAKPGYMFNTNWLVYARVGAAVSSLKIQSENNNLFNVEDANKITPGMRLGAGVDYHVGDSTSIFLDYIYSKYSKVSDDYTNTSTGNTYINEFSPSSNKFLLGIVFHF